MDPLDSKERLTDEVGAEAQYHMLRIYLLLHISAINQVQ